MGYYGENISAKVKKSLMAKLIKRELKGKHNNTILLDRPQTMEEVKLAVKYMDQVRAHRKKGGDNGRDKGHY